MFGQTNLFSMLTPEWLSIRPEYLLQIAIWSLFTALLSLFLEFCMRKRNILGWWLEFLAARWLKKNDRVNYDLGKFMESQGTIPEGYDSLREWVFEQVHWFWFKPLGYCVVCMNVWICFAFIPLVGLNFIEIIGFILLSNFLVRISHGYML